MTGCCKEWNELCCTGSVGGGGGGVSVLSADRTITPCCHLVSWLTHCCVIAVYILRSRFVQQLTLHSTVSATLQFYTLQDKLVILENNLTWCTLIRCEKRWSNSVRKWKQLFLFTKVLKHDLKVEKIILFTFVLKFYLNFFNKTLLIAILFVCLFKKGGKPTFTLICPSS